VGMQKIIKEKIDAATDKLLLSSAFLILLSSGSF
jgi:hypothetical protein